MQPLWHWREAGHNWPPRVASPPDAGAAISALPCKTGKVWKRNVPAFCEKTGTGLRCAAALIRSTPQELLLSIGDSAFDQTGNVGLVIL